MTWLQAMPTVLAAIALLMVPGLVLTYLLGLRGIAAAGVAPALSISVFAVVAVIAGAAGVRWSVGLATLALAVLAAIAGALLLVRRWRDVHVPGDERGVQLWALGGIVVAMLLGAWVFHRAIGSADDMNQTWDSVYHYSALAWIRDSGNASSLHLSGVGVPDVASGFYPAAWHDGTSLLFMLTGASIPLAANVFSAAVTLLVWPLGCVLLVRQVVGPNRLAVGAAGVLSIAFSAFPWGLIGFGVLWPNLAGLAMVPASLALVISICGVAQQDAVGRARAWTLLPVLVIGVALAHPNAVFGLLLISVFPVAIAYGRWVMRQHRAGRTWFAVITTVVLLAVLYAIRYVVNTSSLMSGVINFDWPAFETPAGGVGEVLSNAPNGKSAAWLASLLVIIGAVSCFRQRKRRWLVVGHVVFGILYIAAAALEGIWSLRLTGYWYNDSYRLAAMIPITGVPLAVLGVQATATAARNRLVQWSPERTKRLTLSAVGAVVVALLVVATGGMYLKDHTVVTATTYPWPGERANQAYVDRQKSAFFKKIAAEVPADAVIAGDPYAGTAAIWALSGRRVLFAMPGWPLTKDYEYLAGHLNQAATDPRVCDLVNRYHVTYLVTADNLVVGPTEALYTAYAGLRSPAAASTWSTPSARSGSTRSPHVECWNPASTNSRPSARASPGRPTDNEYGTFFQCTSWTPPRTTHRTPVGSSTTRRNCTGGCSTVIQTCGSRS
ncbi:hypothetical protein GCM10029964_125290 [Kibdelosporangium lantanae]